MRLIAITVLAAAMPAAAEGQTAGDWLAAAMDARDDAVRAEADCTTAVDEAILALSDVRDRAAHLEAAGAITRQQLLDLGLAAAYERQWQMHHAVVAAARERDAAESDWPWAWDHCRRGRGPWLVGVWCDVRDSYESAWILALDELDWAEAASQWLDDHESRNEEGGFK
jgi:hypothetical protein